MIPFFSWFFRHTFKTISVIFKKKKKKVLGRNQREKGENRTCKMLHVFHMANKIPTRIQEAPNLRNLVL